MFNRKPFERKLSAEDEAALIGILEDIPENIATWKPKSSPAIFSDFRAALYCLVKIHKLEPKQALNEISGLSLFEINFLTKMYHHGLRREHFLNCDYKDALPIFQNEHEQVFLYLLKHQHEPQEIMQIICRDEADELKMKYKGMFGNQAVPQVSKKI